MLSGTLFHWQTRKKQTSFWTFSEKLIAYAPNLFATHLSDISTRRRRHDKKRAAPARAGVRTRTSCADFDFHQHMFLILQQWHKAPNTKFDSNSWFSYARARISMPAADEPICCIGTGTVGDRNDLVQHQRVSVPFMHREE